MGWDWRRKLLDEHMPAGLSSTARFVLAEIADMTNETAPDKLIPVAGRSVTETLCRRVGIAPRGLKEVCTRLAEAGLDPRVPMGTDRRGKPLLAVPGRSLNYRLPRPLVVKLLGDVDTSPSAQGDARTSPSLQGDAVEAAGDVGTSPLPLPLTTATTSAGEADASPAVDPLVAVVVERFGVDTQSAADAIAAAHADPGIHNPAGLMHSSSTSRIRVLQLSDAGRKARERDRIIAAQLADPDRCGHRLPYEPEGMCKHGCTRPEVIPLSADPDLVEDLFAPAGTPQEEAQ